MKLRSKSLNGLDFEKIEKTKIAVSKNNLSNRHKRKTKPQLIKMSNELVKAKKQVAKTQQENQRLRVLSEKLQEKLKSLSEKIESFVVLKENLTGQIDIKVTEVTNIINKEPIQ